MTQNERKLIIEHARLVAELGTDKDAEAKIRERLSEIEHELNLTRHEIAQRAMRSY